MNDDSDLSAQTFTTDNSKTTQLGNANNTQFELGFQVEYKHPKSEYHN